MRETRYKQPNDLKTLNETTYTLEYHVITLNLQIFALRSLTEVRSKEAQTG